MIDKQEIVKHILKEIGSLPPIPENITKLRQLIYDPKSNVKSISVPIKEDISLTAQILKIANSASYMSRSSVDSVEMAISIIGLRQLSSVLLSIGAKKIVEEKFGEAEEIWNHSYKCAFYTQNLLKMKNLTSELDSAYTAGLLHDIGRVVLLSITPEILHRIEDLNLTKGTAITEIEKLAIGLSHAELGEMIASKWNFPPKLTTAIGNHHTPLLAKKEWRPLTYAVYLGNIICKLDNYSLEVATQIEPKVLDFFEIDSEKKLEMIINTLNEFYRTAKELDLTSDK